MRILRALAVPVAFRYAFTSALANAERLLIKRSNPVVTEISGSFQADHKAKRSKLRGIDSQPFYFPRNFVIQV